MLNALESLEARRLLAATGMISGSVYDDLNANATRESGEAGVKKVRLFLDANNNGVWDSRTETSALTDKRGQFQFSGLSEGTYRLREVATENTIISAPRSSWFRIKLADGQHVARRQFANVAITRIPGAIGDQDQLIHGVTTSTTDTLIKYTYNGDTDFNGVVNFDDYSRTDASFNNNRTGWFNGDFDYNGIVDFDDYTLIDHAFNSQNGGVLQLVNPTTPPSTPATPPATPSIRSIARADFKLTHDDHSLLSAKSRLSGDKDVIRSSGLQTVIDHYHQYGIDYKREFLRLTRGY